MMKNFNLKDRRLNLKPWRDYKDKVKKCKKKVKIAMIGKYVDLLDSYKSLNEALYHAGVINNKIVDNDKIIIGRELFEDNYLKLSIGKKRHLKIEIN